MSDLKGPKLEKRSKDFIIKKFRHEIDNLSRKSYFIDVAHTVGRAEKVDQNL